MTAAKATSETSPTPAYPVRVFDVVVRRVRDMTPHFRRITFAGPALNRFGVPGPVRDLRIKLLLAVPGYPLSLPGTPEGQLHEGWYQEWLRGAMPERGFIRSYTIRDQRTTDHRVELDVDFVIHPGTGGPGSDWALAAAPGATAAIIGPDASAITAATPLGQTGIRWDPQGARQVLLAGDETAVPAICSILEALPADVAGQAFLEVPDNTDFLEISTGSAVRITWLARHASGASRGDLLLEAVRAAVQTSDSIRLPELYAWVGAEAGTVKALRRFLVNQIGLDPKRSEFRAYWSLGKAGSGTDGTPIDQLGHTIGSF